MRKMHVKVVLDLLVVADESLIDPAEAAVQSVMEANIVSDEVDIQDVHVVNYEITDSR